MLLLMLLAVSICLTNFFSSCRAHIHCDFANQHRLEGMKSRDRSAGNISRPENEKTKLSSTREKLIDKYILKRTFVRMLSTCTDRRHINLFTMNQTQSDQCSRSNGGLTRSLGKMPKRSIFIFEIVAQQLAPLRKSFAVACKVEHMYRN